MTSRPRDRAHLLIAAAVALATLVLPWPVGPIGEWHAFHRAVPETARELYAIARLRLGHLAEFRALVETPGSGQEVLPWQVREMLAMLDGAGRGVRKYDISDGIASSEWTRQQLVASTWPRRMERGAKVRFQLTTEPLPDGCHVIAGRKETLLAYCP
jgi:hypothetical protein